VKKARNFEDDESSSSESCSEEEVVNLNQLVIPEVSERLEMTKKQLTQ